MTNEMHKGMLKALNSSIKMYKKKIEKLNMMTGAKLVDVKNMYIFGKDSCPMCGFSEKSSTSDCEHCIIGKAFDGNTCCSFTPYDDIRDALNGRGKVTTRFIGLVKSELRYLEDLKVRYLESSK